MSNKKVRKKSKAAEVTAQKRAERVAEAPPAPAPRVSAPGQEPDLAELPEKVEFEGGGGLLTSMRGGFQSAVGGGGRKRRSSWISNLIWLLLIAGMLVFAFGPGTGGF